MKRTARLITTIAAIVLTLVIMSVGIYAATKITINNGATNILFSAKDVKATVTASRKMSTEETATSLTITGGTNGQFALTDNQGESYTESITVGNIVFNKVSDTFTLTLTVKNDFDTTKEGISLKVGYSASTSDTNGYVEIAKTKSGVTATTDDWTNIVVASGETLVITTTISITSDTTKQNALLVNGFNGITFSFALNIERAAA